MTTTNKQDRSEQTPICVRCARNVADRKVRAMNGSFDAICAACDRPDLYEFKNVGECRSEHHESELAERAVKLFLNYWGCCEACQYALQGAINDTGFGVETEWAR